MYIRSFKYDSQLEVWVKNTQKEPFKLFKTYKVCALAGTLGPKRMQGDYQVPEGFYYINEFNPRSNYHLALGINYPNASDKILSDAHRPGNNIYIHGNCVSTGCIAIQDGPIEEVYLMTLDAKKRMGRNVPIHIFPRRLDAEGTPFIGLLYAGLILTPQGIKVIEFNARFGDPETQVVLPRLVDPLSALLLAAASGNLEDLPRPAFSDTAAVTVVLASEGYPEAPITGRAITGLDTALAIHGVTIAHAATAIADDELLATGGRVLSVVAIGGDFAEARSRAYLALEAIELEGGQYRTDIAAKVAG